MVRRPASYVQRRDRQGAQVDVAAPRRYWSSPLEGGSPNFKQASMARPTGRASTFGEAGAKLHAACGCCGGRSSPPGTTYATNGRTPRGPVGLSACGHGGMNLRGCHPLGPDIPIRSWIHAFPMIGYANSESLPIQAGPNGSCLICIAISPLDEGRTFEGEREGASWVAPAVCGCVAANLGALSVVLKAPAHSAFAHHY